MCDQLCVDCCGTLLLSYDHFCIIDHQDSEESEEEEEALTEEQFKQTEGYKLIINDFLTIAKKYVS